MKLNKVTLLLCVCLGFLPGAFASINTTTASTASNVVLQQVGADQAGVKASASGVVMQTEPVAKVQQPEQPQVQQQGNIPWGIISILLMLLFLGLLFFRKSKANPGFSSGSANANSTNMHLFNLPTNRVKNAAPIKRTISAAAHRQQQPVSSNATGTAAAKPGVLPRRFLSKQSQSGATIEKMPDGIEPTYFLRQARGIFLHIQSAKHKDTPAEIAKYMTPTLYQEMYDTIVNNGFIAEFTDLNCQLVKYEVKEKQLLATVRFFGLVGDEPDKQTAAAANEITAPCTAATDDSTSESPATTELAQPFSEIWHFVKADLAQAKWLIAGIEQDTSASQVNQTK